MILKSQPRSSVPVWSTFFQSRRPTATRTDPIPVYRHGYRQLSQIQVSSRDEDDSIPAEGFI